MEKWNNKHCGTNKLNKLPLINIDLYAQQTHWFTNATTKQTEPSVNPQYTESQGLRALVLNSDLLLRSDFFLYSTSNYCCKCGQCQIPEWTHHGPGPTHMCKRTMKRHHAARYHTEVNTEDIKVSDYFIVWSAVEGRSLQIYAQAI